MASQDERTQIFDYVPGELKQFEAGTPVSASHLNTLVDSQNRERSGVPFPEQIIREPRGGSIRFAIIRGWPDPGKDVLDVSMIVRDSATGKWSIPEKATVEVVCSPGLRAQDYEAVQWIGPDGLEYPLELPRQITVLAQPIVSVGSSLVAMWLPSIVPADPLPDNVDVSDGFVVDGASEVSFAITA